MTTANSDGGPRRHGGDDGQQAGGGGRSEHGDVAQGRSDLLES